MFYQFRDLQPGEFIVVGGDCSQGGDDYNACQFLSKTRLDVPIVFHEQGVASQMTAQLVPALNHIFDVTGVKPTIALERNNGGASEMDRLDTLNRDQKYTLYLMKTFGVIDSGDTNKLGYATSSATRPKMLGDVKEAIDSLLVALYHKQTVSELFSFIKKGGKPQAEIGSHDDLVMALAIAWQLYQTENPPVNRVLHDFPSDDNLFEGGFY